MKQTCGNCRFYRFDQCRRNSPTAAFEMRSDRDGPYTYSVHAVFPVVRDDDWCGEWQGEVKR